MDYNVTYRKKDGGWQYIINVKRDGKWKYETSKQGFTTKALAKLAADDKLDKLKKAAKLNIDKEYEGITFGEFKTIYMKNLALYKEPNTYINFNTMFTKFEDMEDVKMSDVSYTNIQNCVNKMVKAGLKESTIQEYIRKLNTVFNNAIKPYKIITESPVTDILVPESKEKHKIRALNKHELDDLLERIEPEKDYIISLIAATCGLRIGEIIGLTWKDINLEGKQLHITKQWKKLKDGTYGFGTLKTKNSNRIIPVPANTINALKKYKNNTVIDLVNNRLFLDKTTKSTVTRLFYKYRKLGYEISLHDLRHTYATMLIANGVDFKTVAQLLGHTVEMTMKTYSHVNQDMIDMATSKINAIF